MKLRDGGRNDVETLIVKTCNRHLGFDEPILIEEVAEHDAALAPRDVVGANAMEKCASVISGGLIFGEWRKIHQADAFAHRERFLAHRLPPIRAAEGKGLALAASRVPARAFPAEDLRELRALRLELVVKRGFAQIPANLVLLGGFVAI